MVVRRDSVLVWRDGGRPTLLLFTNKLSDDCGAGRVSGCPNMLIASGGTFGRRLETAESARARAVRLTASCDSMACKFQT